MLRSFIRIPEFVEFTKFKESSASLIKNSTALFAGGIEVPRQPQLRSCCYQFKMGNHRSTLCRRKVWHFNFLLFFLISVFVLIFFFHLSFCLLVNPMNTNLSVKIESETNGTSGSRGGGPRGPGPPPDPRF